MKKSFFMGILFVLMLCFTQMEVKAQFDMADIAPGSKYGYVTVDSTTAKYSDSFGFGYNFNWSTPVYVGLKATNTGTSGEKPRITSWLDGSYDNSIWFEHVDTIYTADSSALWKRVELTPSKAKGFNYYRISVQGTSANPDSVTCDFLVKFNE